MAAADESLEPTSWVIPEVLKPDDRPHPAASAVVESARGAPVRRRRFRRRRRPHVGEGRVDRVLKMPYVRKHVVDRGRLRRLQAFLFDGRFFLLFSSGGLWSRTAASISSKPACLQGSGMIVVRLREPIQSLVRQLEAGLLQSCLQFLRSIFHRRSGPASRRSRRSIAPSWWSTPMFAQTASGRRRGGREPLRGEDHPRRWRGGRGGASFFAVRVHLRLCGGESIPGLLGALGCGESMLHCW